MRYREKKSNDQDDVEKAYQLLLKLIEKHQKTIEPALWVSAMICALAENYEKSGVSFYTFKREIDDCMHHYSYNRN